MEPINFITVCTEKYTSDYANKSLSMFKRNFGGEFKSFCITDKSNELNKEYTSIGKQNNFNGWWNKISIFDQNLPYENTLYIDLDLLIMNDITKVISFAMNNIHNYEIACFGDHIGWKGIKFGSALMFFNQAKMKWLYNNFIINIDNNMKTEGGDQVWIGKHLTNVLYLENHFSNLVKSLKFDLSQKSIDGSKLIMPVDIEKDFMMLNCHGRPKPHQLEEMGWPPIKSIWR